jgi:hypothetical protein
LNFIELSPTDLKIRISESLPGADFLKEIGSSFAPQGTNDTFRTLKLVNFWAVQNHHPGACQIDNETCENSEQKIYEEYDHIKVG